MTGEKKTGEKKSAEQKNREQVSLADTLKVFLGSHRKPLFGISIALIALVFASVVAYQVHHNRQEQAARQAEEISESWLSWQNEQDDQSETDIREAIETLLAAHPRSYGALRALHILMLLEWEMEQFEEAEAAGLRLAEAFPRSHLTGAALATAAAAAEEQGDPARAREILSRIARGEGSPTAEEPRALFNLGRLAEELQDYDEALEYYNRLAGDHPESNWTKLARNRIIWLTSQGGSANT
ncbi:tetratricopeptide repeat protein [Alkalispirochaeta alkalica]|uniref:tetratricopeptide repeat protein n=1 Tax=Alkalispirochaeta alkalica TaxID=46356 RepID=UPI00037B9552|nr:tetratricopeptide repeat protein [Alkalispirochaeta alkalica]